MSGNRRKPAVALAATAAIALFASACTGQSSAGAKDDASKETTINFWHGWSAPNEVKGIQDTVDAFEKAHPNIHVKVVGNMTDDKINQRSARAVPRLRTSSRRSPRTTWASSASRRPSSTSTRS